MFGYGKIMHEIQWLTQETNRDALILSQTKTQVWARGCVHSRRHGSRSESWNHRAANSRAKQNDGATESNMTDTERNAVCAAPARAAGSHSWNNIQRRVLLTADDQLKSFLHEQTDAVDQPELQPQITCRWRRSELYSKHSLCCLAAVCEKSSWLPPPTGFLTSWQSCVSGRGWDIRWMPIFSTTFHI